MSRPVFSIRPARGEDAADLLRIHRRAIRELGRGRYSESELESWAHGLSEDFYRAAIVKPSHFEVAHDAGGAVIAFAATRGNEVWLLYVDPDWARRGVGSALLERAERHLFAAGHDAIWVQSSLNAEPFYAAHGYGDGKTIDAETRGGRDVKAVIMTKTRPS